MWCPLPWTHVSVKNNGTLRVCSHSQSAGSGNTLFMRGRKVLTVNSLSPDVLNNDTSKQIRKDIMEGKWPDQCKRCQLEFESDGISRNVREAANQSIPTETLLQNTLEDGTLVDPQITDYDLRIGNFCNLRCVMCFPGESSKWYDIYEDVMETDTFKVDGKSYKISDGIEQFNWIRQRGLVEQVVEAAPSLTKLSLSGGEPMVIKHHMDILRGLIDGGIADQVTLEYQTNGTTIPQTLMALWKNFKEVQVGVSIDGLKDVNDAIRFPSKWDVVEQTLKALDISDGNIVPHISSTIHLLSLEHHKKLVDWIEDQRFKKIKILNSHIVYNPKYLSIALLDRDVFNDMVNQHPQKEYYTNLYNKISLDDDRIDMYRAQFVSKFYKFQLIQNQDWISLFPEMYKVIKQWEVK